MIQLEVTQDKMDMVSKEFALDSKYRRTESLFTIYEILKFWVYIKSNDCLRKHEKETCWKRFQLNKRKKYIFNSLYGLKKKKFYIIKANAIYYEI